MPNLKWEEVSLKARIKVWRVYRQTLYKKEGWYISFEQCDIGWHGSRWTTIKYTFGKV